jgi:hypothetical protein
MPFPKEAQNRSTIAGERTMSDVWGPARVESIGKSKYYISFTDDAKRFCTVLFMKKKGESGENIKKYVATIERKFGQKVKYLRFDNGKELVNKDIQKWADDKGIVIETTAPYSPSQHGVAERFNRTLLEIARAMLIEKQLPAFLWPEAVAHAVYIRNRSPTKALEGMTPYEAWTGIKPDVSHFREFGCDVWVLNQGEKGSKLAPKSQKMKFMGFLDGSKAIRYYDPSKRTIRVSRNVTFNENEEPSEIPIVTNLPGLTIEGEQEENINYQTPKDQETTPHPEPAEPIPVTEQEQDTPSTPQTIVPSRPRRNVDRDYAKLDNPARQPTKRIIQKPLDVARPTQSSSAKQKAQNETVANIATAFISAMQSSEDNDPESLPNTIEQAQNSTEWPHWNEAILAELNQLEAMGTWTMEDLPEGREAIGNRWTFVRKRDENGKIVRHKARLVVQGFSQKPGTDYNELGTFAPVMRFDTVRTILALAAVNDWDLRQMDVKGAYLHGQISEELYMKQPLGFNDGSGKVCRLRRSMYGLKQAGNVWNQDFNQTMLNLGYTRLKSDYCAYILRKGDKFSIIIIYVDDILAVANSKEMNDEAEKALKSKYEIKVIGDPALLLGIQITRDRKQQTISLSQSQYIHRMLKRFGMEKANPVSTPMDINVKLYDTPDGEEHNNEENKSLNYATAIGSLMYAAHATRPDILYAVITLAQYTKNPSPIHWTAVKRIFRYLKGTVDYKLTYGGRDQKWNSEVTQYVDSDWASNQHRKSISGYVFTLAGGAIAWSSKKQTTTALSSTEAEYVAAVHATKQVLWQGYLLDELGITRPKPSILWADNQGAIAISRNPEFHARTKHIDIALHFLRDHVEGGNMEILYVPSDDNVADVFTKAQPRPAHISSVQELGLH